MYNRGMNDTIRPNGINDQSDIPKQQQEPAILLHGQVIEVMLGPEAEKQEGAQLTYVNPMDIGVIRFRNIRKDGDKSDSECRQRAYPLDKSITRYPLPGEQVLVFVGKGDYSQPPPNTNRDTKLFYITLTGPFGNITDNTSPQVLGGTFSKENSKVGSDDPNVQNSINDNRFRQKITEDAYYEGANSIYRKELRPAEGDVLMQGRFGSSIRLGSIAPTPTAISKETKPWEETGTVGNPIMVLRVDDAQTTRLEESTTIENINIDDSSIYLCSTQHVELKLACSRFHKTWRAQNGIANSSGDGGTSRSTLERTNDPATLYQKF